MKVFTMRLDDDLVKLIDKARVQFAKDVEKMAKFHIKPMPRSEMIRCLLTDSLRKYK
jgi:hypothetical protein